MNSRFASDRGSLPMVLLAVVIIAGLITALLSNVAAGENQARFDQSYEQSLQVAEVGLSRATHLIQARAVSADFCIDSSDQVVPAASCAPDDVHAVQDAGGDWVVTANGSSGDTRRDVRLEVKQKSIFNMAAFGKFFADFNGGNGADSYRSGTWDTSTMPATFTEDTGTLTGSAICLAPSTTTLVTDASAASQSDVRMCSPRTSGVVATNGRLKLKGQTYDATDAIEIHNAMAPNVPDPLPDAAGYCDGVTQTCNDARNILTYHRDPIVLPAVDDSQCNYAGAYTQPFPNASYEVSGQYVLPGGVHCFTNVQLDGATVITGTAENPTRIYLNGTLVVPNGEAVNFHGAGTGVPPTRPRPAPSLLIFSTGTDDLQFGNHASIAGVIMAPNAGFSGGAQGNIYGSLIASSINNNGGWNFHYDEALGEVRTNSYFVIDNWSEELPTP